MLQADLLFADRYRLIKCIGRGGFAEVWLAEDTLADLQVAIKIYGGMDEDGLKIFVKEINKVYHLNHTNLLKPQHVAAWNNMPYLVMTYCSAGSLEKKIGQITEQEIWKILHDVASGLAYLHSNNIIHQDIKPANILQDDMGNYVIIDFGISTLARDTLRKSTLRGNTSAGTLAYMAPERFSKDPTPLFASDIWSFGAMLFELLEGKTPFPADFGGGMQKAGAELLDITANVSQELKSLIYKMLSLNTWDRPTATTIVEWTKNPSAIEKPSRPTQRKITKPAEQPQQSKQPKFKRWIWISVLMIVVIYFIPTIVDLIQIKWLDYSYAAVQILDSSGNQGNIYDQEEFIVEFHSWNYNWIDGRRIDGRAYYRIDGACVVPHSWLRAIPNTIYESSEGAKEVVISAYHISFNGIRIKLWTKTYEIHKRSESLVDLGLSVKWATCNMGATKPENKGNYFAWGHISGRSSQYSWGNYKWCENGLSYRLTKYNINTDYGLVDNRTILDKSDDAAFMNWGDEWRIPTKAEFQELIDNCEWTKVDILGKKGFKVTSRVNGNHIFLPVTGCQLDYNTSGENEYGYYWTNTLNESKPSQAYMMNFGIPQGRTYKIHVSNRNVGRCIRPVHP